MITVTRSYTGSVHDKTDERMENKTIVKKKIKIKVKIDKKVFPSKETLSTISLEEDYFEKTIQSLK